MRYLNLLFAVFLFLEDNKDNWPSTSLLLRSLVGRKSLAAAAAAQHGGRKKVKRGGGGFIV